MIGKGWGVFRSNKYCAEVLAADYHNRSTGGSSGNEKSTENSVMWREIDYNYEPY